jgi:hypothetical protein
MLFDGKRNADIRTGSDAAVVIESSAREIVCGYVSF